MKHGLFKRALSLALCLLMVVTVVPFTASAVSNDIVVYTQNNSDYWKNIYNNYWWNHQYGYSDSKGTVSTNMSASACGILSYVNAVYYLNKCFIDPVELADWSVKNGHRVNGSGTAGSLYKSFANAQGGNYGIKFVGSISSGSKNYWENLKDYLLEGNVAVIHTTTRSSGEGHIMAIVDYNSSNNKYLLLDSYPTSSRATKSTGGIRWATSTELNKLSAFGLAHIIGNDVKVVVDQSYPTNFTATAKGSSNDKIAVYSSKYGGSKLTNRWIGGGDECTIHEVYMPGGRCKLTYPGSNNQPVTGYYANISDFNIGDYSISVNKEGNTSSSMTAKYLVYPEWIYPGTYYEAYSGAVTSNNPLVSVTVSISSKDTDTRIVKNWKENDSIPTRAVTFIEDLPIKPEEFAGLKQGKYTFKVSASCNKKILGFINITTDEVTIFESTFDVSKNDPVSSGNTTVTSRSGGRREVVAVQAKTTNYNSSNTVNAGNNYMGVSSYPIGIYKVKVNTSLNVRKGPGTSYARISSYKNGDTVNVTATNGNWGYTDRGWICLDYATFVSVPQTSYDSSVNYGTGNYVVTTSAGLNCRTGVGTNHGTIKTLPHGTQFSVTQTDGAWGFSPEHGGWLCLQYASYVSALEPALPVPALPELSTTTSSEIGVNELISFKWNAVETAEIYNVKLIDANSNKEIQSITVSGTNASFKAPYEGKFNVSVSASNSQHEGPAATLYGFDVKGPSTVTFKDWDGKVISTQSVVYGKDATAPVSPSRVGHTFEKWDGDFKEVREDRTITATYTRNKYKVTFCDYNGNVIGTQDVYYGDAANAPSYTAPTGYSFVKWDTDFSNITKTTTVKAVVSWTSIYPLAISTSSAVQRNNKSYIVTSIVNNSPNTVSNARIIAVLKTKENKLLATVQSSNLTLAKGEVKNLTLTASYEGMATKAEIFVVKADNENIPLAKQLERTVDQGTAWSSWSTSKPPADALQTQSRTEYRYRDKQFTTSTSSSLSGWTLRNDVTNPSVSYGSWSGWSAWQDAYVGSSDTVNVGTQTVQSGFTAWGAWSEWQDAYVGSNDLTRVETRNVDNPNSPIYQEVVVGYQYNYFRYSTGEFAKGGSDKATSTYGTQRFTYHTSSPLTKQTDTKGNYLGYGYEYTKPTGGYISVWKDDPFETKITENRLIGYNQKTQYRYSTRNYAYKTQYRYQTRSKTTTYYFWKWGNWSNWSTTAVSGTSNRAVETRTTYRYISNTANNIETTAGKFVEPVTGYVDKSYASRQALLVVTDKNDTIQFVGQTQIDANGYYEFNFKTKDEVSVETGDYKVMLSIEGTSAAFELEPIKAPVPEYTVKFVDHDGTVVSEQIVEQGKDASVPEPLNREGYRFIGWDKSYTNIQGNVTINAQYEIKNFDVVFVDEINDTSVVERYNYGDTLVAPEVTLNDAYNFLGWDAVIDGKTKVTGNMVVTAKFEKKMFTVDFLDFDGSILETQEIEYGEPAVTPELIDRDNYVFICWNITGDINYVTENMTVSPYFEYAETVAMPTASIESGTYSGEQKVTLTCETEGAQIYYTTDGTDPLEEVTNARARSVQLRGTLYTGPFTLDSSAQLLFTAVKDGMNSSEYDYKTLAINTADTETKQYTVTIHYGIYDAENTILVNDGELVVLDETELYNYGYTLDGVYTDADYKNAWNLETDAVKAETDLYLKWTINNYTVTFEDMDGNVIDAQEVAFGEDAVAPMWSEIEGYIFTGWDTDYTNVIEDLTVTATYISDADVTSVEFNKDSLTLDAGQTATIEATVKLGVDCTNDALIWQSSDEDVVIVDDNGNITAVTGGTASIFAISEDSGMSAQCEITVKGQHSCETDGHIYKTEVIAPDCTERGYTVYTCSACGDSYTDDFVSATGHKDADSDNFCDECGEKTGSGVQNNCSHLCHKGGFLGFIWKVINFFNKLFKINRSCSCGGGHW